jgi:tyrosyl-tRNA synthetase
LTADRGKKDWKPASHSAFDIPHSSFKLRLHLQASSPTMRILSGLQPSGRLHIGNYFGMMKPALKLQHEGDAYYFIADYHSLTSVQDGKALRELRPRTRRRFPRLRP